MKKNNKKKMKIHIGVRRVPASSLWGGDGGRKFSQEWGGAGMGDGVGITGRGRGIGSPPQTHHIAIHYMPRILPMIKAILPSIMTAMKKRLESEKNITYTILYIRKSNPRQV